MNEVNKTLFISLYGKALISKKGIILKDRKAEEIWDAESFDIKGKSKSKWLAYNVAMRARVFDDWTNKMLFNSDEKTIVLHIGCGLDSRCLRVKENYYSWLDCDFPGVISVRRQHYEETSSYKMIGLDASNRADIDLLPDADSAIIIMEGISMYLSREKLVDLLKAPKRKI